MPPAKDPYRYFRLEARELLDAMGQGVIMLERSGMDEALVQQMLRHAHTLKGAAGVVKQNAIAQAAHAIEDALTPLRDARGDIPTDTIAALSGQLAIVESGLAALALPTQQPEPGGADPVAPLATLTDAIAQTVRADIIDIDRLLEGVAETSSQISAMRAGLRAIEDAQRLADLAEANLAPRATSHGGHQGSTVIRAHAFVTDLQTAFAGIEQELGTAVDRADRELAQLRETIEQMRLMPASLLFAPTERTASEAARMLGKQVRFEGHGGNIRLDATILDSMQRVLIQLVRNALAHGIGTADQRTSVGKPGFGTIRLAVSRQGSRIRFDFSDDGRGVDVDALRQSARAQGLPDLAENELGPDGLLRVLMASGVSTAEDVSEVAGRGIGLDIVREAMETIRGTIAISSAPGAGTQFRVEVPLSLSSLDVLHFECAGRPLAIPLDAVASTLRIAPGSISATSAGASISYEGVEIPFLPLELLLEGGELPEGRVWSAILLRGTDELPAAACGVDRLLGSGPIVMRPLPPLTPADGFVVGTWLDKQGDPQLLLDAAELATAVLNGHAPTERRQEAAPLILVIDDSMTTRMLEESILLSAGYRVDTASSAEDALEAAQRQRYDLFLVDVEMPGMSGFDFVEHIRSDPTMKHVPAILVSSRNAPQDLQRGTDVGAQGYMVKGEFDQRRLLTLIRELAG
jgi:two-component system chemotaxis sensor kinase CheA